MSKFRVQWSFESSSSHKLNQCHYLNQKTRYRHHQNRFFISLLIFHSTCTARVTTKNASFLYFSIGINVRMMIHEKLSFITRTWLLCNFCIIIWFSFLFWNWIIAINTFSTKRTNSRIKTSKNRHESDSHKINFVFRSYEWSIHQPSQNNRVNRHTSKNSKSFLSHQKILFGDDVVTYTIQLLLLFRNVMAICGWFLFNTLGNTYAWYTFIYCFELWICFELWKKKPKQKIMRMLFSFLLLYIVRDPGYGRGYEIYINQTFYVYQSVDSAQWTLDFSKTVLNIL